MDMDHLLEIAWRELPPWPKLWPDIVRTPWDALSNATATDCETERYRKHLGEIIMLSTAGAVFVLLNILKCVTKRSLKQLVIPVDLLTATPFRLIYCLILTLWAADVFQDAVNSSLYFYSPDNAILDALMLFGLTPFVIFLRQSLLYFPILACVDFDLSCLGYGIGCVYTLLVGCYNVYLETVIIRGCSHRGHQTLRDIAISLSVKLPVYLGYLAVTLWFFHHATIQSVLHLFVRKRRNQCKDSEMFLFHDRVTNLLQRRSALKKRKTGTLFGYAQWGFQYVLPYRSGFKYPLSLLAPLFMALIVIYQFSVELINRQVQFTTDVARFVDEFNITVALVSRLVPAWEHTVETVWYDCRSFAESLYVILPMSVYVASFMCLAISLYLLLNFHKRLLRMAKGDIRFLLESEPLPSKPYILAAGMKFSAFQMSYLVCGWAVYIVMYVGLSGFGLLFYYIFKNFTFLGTRLWSCVMVPMMWGAALHCLQLFLCRFVFWKKAEDGDLVHTRFWSGYQWLAYFFFFFNFMFGVVLSFLRVFASFMFTMVMYFRMDWDVYMRGLEGWDFGHRTYVGYMYLEYTRNNAVLRTFVDLLWSSRASSLPVNASNTAIQEASLSPSLSLNSSKSSTESDVLLDGSSVIKYCADVKATSTPYSNVTYRRARNLWLVGYTLIHNPQLRNLTASQLNAAKQNITVSGVKSRL